MKKIPKIISIFLIAGVITACNETQKEALEEMPGVLSLDLSDAAFVFNGNDCTGVQKAEDGGYINADGVNPANFLFHKTTSEGVTSRVHFKTDRSDDDKYFKDNNMLATLVDISDDYFYADLDLLSRNNQYFINKKTGEALKFPREYRIKDLDWVHTLTARNYFPQDGAGNVYGVAYCYEGQTDAIVKFTVAEKEVKCEKIADVSVNRPNLFAVDNDGNVAFYDGKDDCYFRTVDKELVKQDFFGKLFWTGYDGNIYFSDSSKVNKVTYDKVQKEVHLTATRTFEELTLTGLYYDRLLFLDDLKQIYTYKDGKNRAIVLYQLYGETAIEEPIVISADDIGNPNSSSSGYSLFSSDDSIAFVHATRAVSVIDVKNNMAISKYSLPAVYNEGMRMLRDNKMALFYLNPRSAPYNSSDESDYMRVGVYDLKTGTLSEPDTFRTGNAMRSDVINIK